MQSTTLLKILINVFFYVAVLAVAIILSIGVYATLSYDGTGILVSKTGESVGIVLDENYETSLTFKDYISMIISGLTMVFFIGTLYHLRVATLKMIKGEIFNAKVASSLKWTGMAMILYKATSILGDSFSEVASQSQIKVGLDFSGFESGIFVLILGLFFILLSRVITSGILIKNENDLTV